MVHLCALASCLVFAILAILHLYWACGGTFATAVVIPSDGEKPLFGASSPVTALIALLLAGAGVQVLVSAGMWPLPWPARLERAGTWVLVVLFALRALGDFRYVGFFKKVRHTRFAYWDSRLFSPLCALMSLAMWVVVRG